MKQLLGGILLAVGILIAGASGLCTLSVLFSGGGFNLSQDMSMLPLVLVVGGIPMAVGVAIACGGWALLRRARAERDRDESQ